MSQQAINHILNDIYKTNRLMDDIKEATSKPEITFHTTRLNLHMRSMEASNEFFTKDSPYEETPC